MNTIPVKQVEAGAGEYRKLTVNIFRHNPQDENSVPHMDTFEVEEADSMTLFILLNEIRENQDPTVQFDFVCRAGICGSCAMLVNGRPKLACRTLTQELPQVLNLAPLPGFELIGDLSVNTGKWMRNMSEHLETWIHNREQERDFCDLEEKWSQRSRTKSTNLNVVLNAAAALLPVVPRRCALTLLVRSVLISWRGSKLILGTIVRTLIFTKFWAQKRACLVV